MPYTYNPAIANAGGAWGIRGRGGSTPDVRTYPEAASSTFRKGEIVKIVAGAATDLVASGGASSWAINATTGELIFAVAMQDATGTTGAIGAFTILNDNCEYRTRIYAASASDSEVQDVYIGIALTFGRYTGADTTNIWTMGIATSTANVTNAKVVEIEGVELGTAGTYGADDAPTYQYGAQKPGDDYAVVWVRQATLLEGA